MAVASAALLVLTNGPVLLFSRSVLDRTGRWEDPAVWPFLAAAAAAGAGLAAWDVWGERRRPAGVSERVAAAGVSERIAAAAVVWFTLAALASTLWSVDAAATAWRSSIYAGMALLAWAMSRLDAGDTAAAIGLMAGAAVAASLLLIALRPDLGLGPNDYWKGVYTNRNSLAPLAAVGVLAGVRFVLAPGRLRRVAAALLVAGSTAALVGAGSRTAWVSLVAALVASSLPVTYHWIAGRWGGRRAATITAASAGAGAVAAVICLAAVWDVATLSQRRTIWSLVWDRILQRPLGGHGFFTFWDIEELTQHVLLRRGSAHNSLVEVGLGLGLLGAVPFVAIVALAARNAGLELWRRPGADTWMWAALVAFLLVENVTESFVLWFSYSWVLLMAAALRQAPAAEAPADSASSSATGGRQPGRLRSVWTAVAWTGPGLPARRWASYYLDIPVRDLDEGRLGEAADSDLTVLRSSRMPDFPSGDAPGAPLAEVGDSPVVAAGTLPS